MIYGLADCLLFLNNSHRGEGGGAPPCLPAGVQLRGATRHASELCRRPGRPVAYSQTPSLQKRHILHACGFLRLRVGPRPRYHGHAPVTMAATFGREPPVTSPHAFAPTLYNYC